MKSVLLALSLLSLNAFADWKPKMVARASLIGTSFNLPQASTIANASPKINNRGDITIKLTSMEGEATPAIWLHESHLKSGRIIFRAKTNQYLSNPSFNMDAETVFHHFDEYQSYGVKYYDPAQNKITTLVSPETLPGVLHFSFPQINDQRQVLFRALKEDNTRSVMVLEREGIRLVVKEDDKVSYLFTPSLNNIGHVALKVRLGENYNEEQPDQIRVYESMGGHKVKNQDQNSSRSSKYTSFQNSVNLSHSNYLVYVAKRVDGKKQLLLNQGRSTKAIATEGEGDISKLEQFSPKSNNYGEVLFRAMDKEGKRSVFVYTNRKLKKLVSEGDRLACDLEIDCYVTFKPGFPGISGSPDFNDWGEAVVHLILSDKYMKEYLGAAIYRFSQI